MKPTRIFTLLIAAVCMLLLLPTAGALSIHMDPLSASAVAPVSVSAASANDNYPISVEQAKNSVRLFMNDLTLDPQLSSTGSLEIGNYYHLIHDSDSFEVNQNTGVVEFVHFGANEPDSANGTITRDQAYANATEFAGRKYDDFSGKSWKLVVDTDEQISWRYNGSAGHGEYYVSSKDYDFVFREEKNHVLLPNLVHVRVNPVTGAIIDYWGVDRLVPIDLNNKVALATATETAEYYLKSDFGQQVVIGSTESYLAVVTRYQNVENLAWVIKIKFSYPSFSSDEDTDLVVIDANDGSLLADHWNNIWPESRLTYYLN
jgi:hypothetical protein